MTKDYTPVPNYVAPTEGNMQQAAAQVADWIRTKGNGQDVRESLAQAVQLFGDVAAQFINESAGLKGQFNAAIANENNDAEVQAARTSTTTGTSFGTLGLRLDAIDAEQASHDDSIKNGLVDKTTNQDVDGIKNFLQLPVIKSGRSLLPASDTGWLSDGISWLNSCASQDFAYRVITLGSFKLVCLRGGIVAPANGVLTNGYTSAGNMLSLPSSATVIDGGTKWAQNFSSTSWDGTPICGIRIINGVTLQVGNLPSGTSTSITQQILVDKVLFGVDVSE